MVVLRISISTCKEGLLFYRHADTDPARSSDSVSVRILTITGFPITRNNYIRVTELFVNLNLQSSSLLTDTSKTHPKIASLSPRHSY